MRDLKIQHLGTISHQQTVEKTGSEYEKHKEKIKTEFYKLRKIYVKPIENKTKELKPNEQF